MGRIAGDFLFLLAAMARSVLAMNIMSASAAMQVPPAAPAEAAAFFPR
jgi:hypothetical protein